MSFRAWSVNLTKIVLCNPNGVYQYLVYILSPVTENGRRMLKINFELDILSSSGVIPAQKYIEHIMKCWNVPREIQMSNFFHTLSHWVAV